MKLRPFLLVATACALFIACGDDPFTPTGTYTPAYHASLQTLGGSFSTVCGSGEEDLYAFGPVILHYDGARWEPMASPPGAGTFLIDAVGFASGELVVSDGRDVFLRKDGAWSTLPRALYFFGTLTGRTPDDLYAMRYDGVMHYDGSAWSNLPVPKAHELGGLAVDGAGTPTAVGRYGRVDRYDGDTWSTTYLDSLNDYYSVAITPSGRTFVSGYSAIWEIVDSVPVEILRQGVVDSPLLRTDGEVLYAVGSMSNDWNTHRIGRYADGAWSDVAGGTGRFEDFWAGRGEIVGVGSNALLWRGSASGGAALSPYPAVSEFEDAVRIGDAIYVIGRSSYRYENHEWTDLNKEYLTRVPAFGIDGRDPRSIYAVGEEMILHYDGAAWSWVNGALGTRMRAVWAEEDGGVVAVGTDGRNPTMLEFDGASWSKRVVPLEGYSFYDVCAVGDMVVAVGGGGLIGMRRDDHWYLLRPTGWSLVSVWALDERHIYALSTSREILSYDGHRWNTTPMNVSELEDVRSIWGTSPSNMFVLDYWGRLVHFDGHTWSPLERIFASNMAAVCGDDRSVLTVGRYGSVLYTR